MGVRVLARLQLRPERPSLCRSGKEQEVTNWRQHSRKRDGMRSRAILTIVIVGFAACPSVVLANVGTPLMWAGALHLLFGNLLIGTLEGALLARFFKAHAGRAIGLMIPGNYFSAWVGFVWLNDLIVRRLAFDLYNTWFLLWVMVGVSWALSIVMEWPFVAGSFWKTTRWLRRSIFASLAVQTISYVLLFGWYWLASGATLYTRIAVVPPDSIVLPQGVQLYYIAEDGDVYARDFDTRETKKVFELDSSNEQDCLALRQSPTGENLWDIVALLESDAVAQSKSVPIGVTLAGSAAPHNRDGRVDAADRDSVPHRRQATRLGAARDSSWEFESGFWAREGLRGTNSRTGVSLHVSLETPFAAWAVRHAEQLPDDCVIFQFGERQICILEPETNKVSLIAYGRGPLALLKRALTE